MPNGNLIREIRHQHRPPDAVWNRIRLPCYCSTSFAFLQGFCNTMKVLIAVRCLACLVANTLAFAYRNYQVPAVSTQLDTEYRTYYPVDPTTAVPVADNTKAMYRNPIITDTTPNVDTVNPYWKCKSVCVRSALCAFLHYGLVPNVCVLMRKWNFRSIV